MHINIILNNTHLITSDQKIPDNIFSNQKMPKCSFLVKLLNRLSMIASSIGWRICQRTYLLLFSGPHFKAYLYKIMLCYFYKIASRINLFMQSNYTKSCQQMWKKKNLISVGWFPSITIYHNLLKSSLIEGTKLVKPNVPNY